MFDGRNMLKPKNIEDGFGVDFFLRLLPRNCLIAEEIGYGVCSVTNLIFARKG